MNLPNDSLNNFIFPNNAEVVWSLMIVIYPFITGLIAGAFIVSALSHVMKIKEFEPLAKFALIGAFCFGLFAGMPLLFHLGHPERAFNIYLTPHTTSAMSVFGYVYGSYMVVLMVEIWFVYREFFIFKANSTEGLQRWIWYMLCLGITEYHPGSREIDNKFIYVLSLVGIPWAFFLHGYVGFIFGSVKAIPWWATALQPIIFLSSAVVSGMAMLLVMYSIIKWRSRRLIDYVMIKKFCAIMWGVFIIDWGLEMLELVHVYYRNDFDWTQIQPLISGPIYISYAWMQIFLFSFIPTVILAYVVLSNVTGRIMVLLANIGAVGLILQVLFMRFNVVVGGQLISKSGRGYVEFHWEFLGREGMLTAICLLVAPFVVYYLLSKILPILDEPATAKQG
ncbi:MAG: polysulfide reductase NrfD [Pseudomonadales bacterium]|nr:polysulfide reductase NrfD [Pseudomonadales bacterium]